MLERSEELCPLAGQAALWRAGYHANRTKAEKQNRNRCYRIPICVARHKENVTDRSRTTVRRDSCSSEAKSFAPLRGKPPYGAPKRKQCNKRCFCRSGRSRYNFTKTKVLKRKRQKIHISKHRIPICVARHKETKKNLTRGSA